MTLIRVSELNADTYRYAVARTWPDRQEVAVCRMPVAASPPSWAVFRRVSDGWAQATVWFSAADWLTWADSPDPAAVLPILWPASPAVVALLARRLGRRSTGIELKPSYFRTAVDNMRRLDAELAVPSLFDQDGAA